VVEAKQPLRVASGLFWKPFDARFDEFLSDLRYHADLVNKELLLAQLQETKDVKASIAKEFEDLRDLITRITRTESDRKNTEKIMKDPAGREEYVKALEGKIPHGQPPYR
jgi:hypothetical protein